MRSRKDVISIISMIIILILCILIVSINKKYNLTIKEIETLNESIDKSNILIDTLKKENEALKIEKLELEKELKLVKKDLQEAKKIVYDSNDITKVSNLTYNQLYLALEGYDMQNISYFIIEAEKKYGINALFLTGLIANETGYGSSRRYKEDNNVGGYEVYSPTSKGRSFSSKEESVYAVARLLSEEYLSEDGLYFNGKSSYAINKLYCQSTSSGDMFDWHRTIDKIANDFKSMINSNYKYKNEGL